MFVFFFSSINFQLFASSTALPTLAFADALLPLPGRCLLLTRRLCCSTTRDHGRRARSSAHLPNRHHVSPGIVPPVRLLYIPLGGLG